MATKSTTKKHAHEPNESLVLGNSSSTRRGFLKTAGVAAAATVLPQVLKANSSWLDMVSDLLEPDDLLGDQDGCGYQYPSASIDVSGFYPQVCSNWCWASTVTNLLNYYADATGSGCKTWTVCQVANFFLNNYCTYGPAEFDVSCCSSGHDGNPSCDDSSTGPCNLTFTDEAALIDYDYFANCEPNNFWSLDINAILALIQDSFCGGSVACPIVAVIGYDLNPDDAGDSSPPCFGPNDAWQNQTADSCDYSVGSNPLCGFENFSNACNLLLHDVTIVGFDMISGGHIYVYEPSSGMLTIVECGSYSSLIDGLPIALGFPCYWNWYGMEFTQPSSTPLACP